MTLGSVLTTVGGLLILVTSVLGWQQVPVAQRPGATAAVLDGSALFLAKGCATCHTGPDTESDFGGFPDLSDAGSWAAERRPGFTAAAYLHESIWDPGVFMSPAFRPNGPTTGMPTLRMSGAEADALVAYLLAG